MLQHLETGLITHLKHAKRISIAVALIKDYGLTAIENNVTDSCERKYLLGVDLPTPPDILRRLLDLHKKSPIKVQAKIYDSNENYHPKVYLIEKHSGGFIAFVGSANATRGGFTHNIEMNVVVTDQNQCIKIKGWFDGLFSSSKQYDDAYIDEYEAIFKRNKVLASTQKSNIASITNATTLPVGPGLIISPGQFFRQSDFDAFALPTQYDTKSAAVELRGEVRERLIELNDWMFDYFPSYGITNLHLPRTRNHYTSQHFHSRGNNHIPKEAIWLNYGKSPDQLRKYTGFYTSFVNHARIQIILGNNAREAYIGTWLYVGKPGSSFFERDCLKKGLSEPNFAARIYEYVLALGSAYWIMLGKDELYISDLENSQELRDFLLLDDFSGEFIIGRNYHPNDAGLSEENIEETVLIEFSKLYKIYDLIRA